MTEFVIVVLTSAAALLATPTPGDPAANAALAPLNAPTLGFHVYKDMAACEADVGHLTPPPGTRLACVPVVPYDQEQAATAY